MKAIYFDCFSGISGDMTLGALFDLGIDQEAFRGELDKLKLSGYDIAIEKVDRHGIHGTDVKVILHQSLEDSRDFHKTSRNYKDIKELIEWSDLKQEVKDFSLKVFGEIARAEAAVHNMAVGDIHFHEVGALDSIIDIVGAAICMELLGVKRVFSSPLHDGQGFTSGSHGVLPVPVPAVLQMLKGSKIPFIMEDINFELITPTGMAIIKSLTSSYGSMPAMVIDSIGYGMGKRDTGRLNALRVVVGDLLGESDMLEEISVLETNIDDMSPEIVSYTVERLLKEGALDAFCTPIIMKKGRPAVMLTVLCRNGEKSRLIEILFHETTTLGIREYTAGRYCMDRQSCSVDTAYGRASVKVASMNKMNKMVKISPEYEDCKKLAESSGRPLREIYHAVEDKYVSSHIKEGLL